MNFLLTTLCSNFTVFAIAVDLGRITSTTEPVTWAVGFVRDPSIAYTAPDATVHHLRPYFVTKYESDIEAAVGIVFGGNS